MIENTITDTPRMRTIETKCRIALGARFGIEMMHESHRIIYIPFDGQGELCSGRGYYAELSGGVWKLTDSPMNLKLSFPDRSAMTKWVKRNINK